MIQYALLFAAAFQGQQTQQPTSTLRPSPVARLVIAPAQRTVTAGDTLRLQVQAVDSSGQEVRGARIIFQKVGAYFEGEVDSTGLVTAGSPGVMPISVVALMEGARPVVERIELRMVPGPATRIEISPRITRLAPGQRIRLDAESFSASGDARTGDAITWRSSAPAVVRVNDAGMATAVAAGRATITASAGSAKATLPVQVVATPIASVELTPASPRVRQGDVIRFTATPKDRAGARISGLTPSWTFAPGQGMVDAEGAFVAYEPGEYTVTASFGTRSADAIVRVEPRDVRRPLSVVGRLPRSRFNTEEVWIHPNGKYAYLGSGGGGDVMYAIDISDPSKPRVTDSIIANTRRVNDIMTTPDGKVLVFTREGATDRKNGIVIASLDDPAHPRPISEFTEGVTAGVHSAFIYKDPKYGTHIFLTNDGTGALHVINIDDPSKPKEVAQWRTEGRPDAGRTLHDIDVQNGMLYASYWNDGLVILDVGNGMKGGSPSNPQFVSQFKYDLEALYRDVAATGGPGYIRGTHTAWRYRDYVIIADEVFPASAVKGARDESAGRAYGRLQVVDISDITKPKSVAWYEPEYGGVHNVWVAGDTLYLGAYNAGFHAFDISGELRGDLRAQGREIANLLTADRDGTMPNAAMTWGVVVKDGLAYVNDMRNGLWIVRIEPRVVLP
ncbi:MAG TPA: Ig-like domain-containing protein [Gemmatimonadaceae bacterium]|nr:Ig-like domain-containing protein [Gemmatimonadaceae bacterium]